MARPARSPPPTDLPTDRASMGTQPLALITHGCSLSARKSLDQAIDPEVKRIQEGPESIDNESDDDPCADETEPVLRTVHTAGPQ